MRKKLTVKELLPLVRGLRNEATKLLIIRKKKEFPILILKSETQNVYMENILQGMVEANCKLPILSISHLDVVDVNLLGRSIKKMLTQEERIRLAKDIL
jgi:hypothetical protein